MTLRASLFLHPSPAPLGSPSGFRYIWEVRHDPASGDCDLQPAGICGVQERNGGGEGGGGGLGQACQTLFSSWSWGVKLCVDACVSWPLIRGWDAAAPDPHGRIAGWVCSDPATLMPLTPHPPTRRLMSHSKLSVSVCVCVCVCV